MFSAQSQIRYCILSFINLTLKAGKFPNKLKVTKVIPIYKTDDPELFSNYTGLYLSFHASQKFLKE